MMRKSANSSLGSIRSSAEKRVDLRRSDIIGLLCLHRALEGGESDIVSSHHLYNLLRKERPDVLKTLAEPNWYFDRKGEVSQGEKPYIRCALLYYYKNRIILHHDPYFVVSDAESRVSFQTEW